MVVVLSGVSMINAAMTTQTLVDHFRIERLIMSGISGGIDSAQGTIGGPAWARYLVDFGIAHVVDAREMPKGCKNGFLGIMTKGSRRRTRSTATTRSHRNSASTRPAPGR